MKNRILSAILAALMVAMMVCLVSCGGAGAPASADSGADNAKVAEYAEIVKEQFGTDEMMGMKIDIVARGNSLVYVYTFIDVDEVTAEQVDSMASALDAQFGDGALLADINAECPEVESVIFEYYESDGDLAIAKEYEVK